MSYPVQPQAGQPYVRGTFAAASPGSAPGAGIPHSASSPSMQRMGGGMGGARIGSPATSSPGLTNAQMQQQQLAQLEAQKRLLQQQQALAAQRGAASGARIGAASPTPAATSTTSTRTDDRQFAARQDLRVSRRPSTVVVQSERKTMFWTTLIAQMEQVGGFKMDENAKNDVISRILSIGLVQDKRARDQAGIVDAPPPGPILTRLEQNMLARLTELNNGQQVRLDPKTPVLERICRMEKAIQVLEARKAKEEEEEAAKVAAKMSELQKSLKETTQKKEVERENNRRTVKLEIDNLRDSMAKMAQESQSKGAPPQAMDAMVQKMARLEAALKLMNEERKAQVEDKETVLLKRKLAMFEQKFKELEDSKSIRAAESNADALKDKLLMMEEKLDKMTKRKSMSIAASMQSKMAEMEKQLELMRTSRVGGGGGGNPEMERKMAAMEAELNRMRNTQITPSMVNDEETNALRAHVKKLEQAMLSAEKNMEMQRKKIEEERLKQAEERRREELEFRDASKRREQELLKRLKLMEEKMAQTQAGGSDPNLTRRMQELEQNLASGRFTSSTAGVDPNTAAKLAAIEEQLKMTQKQLAEERELASTVLKMAPTEGPALEDWQNKMQIAWLTEQNKKLMEKLEASTKLMDDKMNQMKNMTFSGGPGVLKSGLSYREINDKLADLQKQLFDPNCDERTQEQLNIEYEKLITELESTAEYQAEQLELKNKWKKENEPLNNQALQEVRQAMRAMGDAAVLELLKTKPELRLVLNTPDQIMKKHENDFNSLTTQNLTLLEARALFAAMPSFRKEQQKQLLWVESLKNKIENELTKPKKAPPPPKAPGAPKPAFKKPPAPPKAGGGGDFLAELLQKRARKE